MDLQSLINHATMLTAAADRLRQDERVEGSVRSFRTAAIIMNALSAEVAFKAHLCRANGIVNSSQLRKWLKSNGAAGAEAHGLATLFKLLPSASQHLIEARLQDFMPDRQNLLLALGDAPPAKLKFQVKPWDFLDRLRQADDQFVSWRYCYEKQMLVGDASFVEALARTAIATYSDPV